VKNEELVASLGFVGSVGRGAFYQEGLRASIKWSGHRLHRLN